MASAQPIGATTSQSPQTSLQLVVRLKTNTIGYTTTTSPIPQSASQESTGLTSPTTQKEVNDSCANCAGSASYRCVGCVDGVDVNGQVSSTFYCGQECQRQHWDTVHKRQCRLSIDRRQLHRIGSFLQWAFYAGQTFTRHETIRRVKRIENTTPGNDDPEMIVWLDKNQDSAHFARFPEEMFTEGRERQAVLAHAAVGVTVVTEMMKLLREGMYCSLCPLNVVDSGRISKPDPSEGSCRSPKDTPFHTIRPSHSSAIGRPIGQLDLPCDTERWLGVCYRRLQCAVHCQHT